MKSVLRFSIILLIAGYVIAMADYCVPSANTTWDEYITGVEFNTIDNSTGASDDGYVDYTNISTEVAPGESYDIVVSYSGAYGSYSGYVWIDFNQDGEFDNSTSTELFELSDNGSNEQTGTIAIPEDALDGETTMRVRLFYGTYNDGPCYEGGYGESEDYAVVIVGGTDIKVSSITLPEQPYYQGEYDVSTSVRWEEGADTESFTLHWEANGEYQGSVDWTGTLNESNKTVDFDLGSVDFTYPEDEIYYLPFYVKVWVDNINGDPEDMDATNNLMTKNTTPVLDDIGLTEIVEPKGNVSLGDQDIIVTLKNYGARTLTSTSIDWAIDGEWQEPFEWTGNLLSGNSIDVNIGTYYFSTKVPLAPYIISAKTSLESDENTDNDESPVSTVGPPISPGTYVIGGDDGFKTIEELNAYITSSGVAGEGVYSFIFEDGTYDDMLEIPLGSVNENYEFFFKSGNCDPDDVTIRVPNTNWDDAIFRFNNMYNVQICGITFEMPSGLGKAIELNNSNRVEVLNCEFNYGGTAIEQNYNLNHYRSLYIIDNVFNNLTNHGINQNYDGFDDLNYTAIEGNEFKGLDEQMRNPIRVSNGAVIRYNVFKDLQPPSLLGADNLLIEMYGSGRNTIIAENSTLRVQNYAGIKMSDTENGDVFNNNFRINGEANYNALNLARTNLEVFENNFDITGAGSTVKMEACRGIFSNNMIVAHTDNSALELVKNEGIYIIYNSVQNISDSRPAVTITTENAMIYRNIFSSLGDSPVLDFMNSDDIGLDENTYFTESDNFAVYNGQNYPDIESWQSISGKDINTNVEKPPFKNDDNLHLVRVQSGLVIEDPVALDMDEEQRIRHENTDYNRDYRGYQDEYYKGADAVMPEINIVDDPQNVLTCQGDTTVMLNVSATVTYGAEINYQWYRDGEEIPGANTVLLTFDGGVNYKHSGYYACEVSVKGGREPIMSNTAAVYVLTKPEIIKHGYENKTQGTDDSYALPGDVVYLNVETHMRGLTPPYYKDKYQWYLFDASENITIELNNSNAKYSGTQSSELVLNNVTQQDLEPNNYYYVEVEGLCGMVTSEAFNLSESLENSITFVSQPVSSDVCESADISFVVDAQGSPDVESINYQWYKDGEILENSARISGVETGELVINNAFFSDIGEYYLEATTVPGNATFSTEKVQLTVNPLPIIITDLNQETLEVEYNSYIDLTIDVADADSYQWYKDSYPIDGETNSFLNILADDENLSGEYYVIGSNDCGEVQSKTVIVTVLPEGWVGVNDNSVSSYTLYNSEPNPVISVSTIKFNMGMTQYAELFVTDAFGQKVATLFNGIANAGLNKVEFNADELKLSSGVYYYTLITSGKRITNKLIIVK